MAKSYEKKCQNYFMMTTSSLITVWWNGAQMSILKRLILSLQPGKNDGFWLLRGIFKEYINQNIIMDVLRKTEEVDIEPSTGKKWFWLLWEISKKYIKQNIVSVKKDKFLFSSHLEIDKTSVMQKKIKEKN